MKFYPESKLICWWPVGVVGSAEVQWYYRQLKECEWGHAANRFCDFSRVTDFGFDYRGLSSLASFRKRELGDHHHVKLVTHSTAPLGYGMARMYQALLEDWPIEIHVERDLERCASILGVDIGDLLPPEVNEDDPAPDRE